jgi:hypothetical protein
VAGFSQLMRKRFYRLNLSRSEKEICSFGRQRARYRAAHSFRGTSNNRYFSFKLHVIFSD